MTKRANQEILPPALPDGVQLINCHGCGRPGWQFTDDDNAVAVYLHDGHVSITVAGEDMEPVDAYMSLEALRALTDWLNNNVGRSVQ